MAKDRKDLSPAPYPFVMNKDLITNFIEIKKIAIPLQTKIKASDIQFRELPLLLNILQFISNLIVLSKYFEQKWPNF